MLLIFELYFFKPKAVLMNNKSSFQFTFIAWVAIIIMILSSLFVVYSLYRKAKISPYKKEGRSIEVNVLETSSKNIVPFFKSYKVKISFFTGSILDGGSLKLVTIKRYINKKIYNKLKQKPKTRIIHIPGKPFDSAIPQLAVDPDYYMFYEKIDHGIGGFIVGFIIFMMSKLIGKKNAQVK